MYVALIFLFDMNVRTHIRSSEGPVHERLLNDASKIRKDVERRESMRLNAESDGMSFHPSLPENSKNIVAVRRKSSVLYTDGDDQSVSTMTTGNVYERLSASHTISSLGGHADSDMLSVMSGSHVGRFDTMCFPHLLYLFFLFNIKYSIFRHFNDFCLPFFIILSHLHHLSHLSYAI